MFFLPTYFMFTIYPTLLFLPCPFSCCWFDPGAICSLLPFYYFGRFAVLYHSPHAFLLISDIHNQIYISPLLFFSTLIFFKRCFLYPSSKAFLFPLCSPTPVNFCFPHLVSPLNFQVLLRKCFEFQLLLCFLLQYISAASEKSIFSIYIIISQFS